MGRERGPEFFQGLPRLSAGWLVCGAPSRHRARSESRYEGVDRPGPLTRGGDKVYSDPGGAEGLAVVPAGQEEAVIEAAEECPGECIFIEVEYPPALDGPGCCAVASGRPRCQFSDQAAAGVALAGEV